MAVTYRIDNDLLILDCEGEYPREDVERVFVRAMKDAATPQRVHLLLDVTGSRSLSGRSSNEIRRTAMALGPCAERLGGRAAVLATSDVHYGLCRMGAVYSEAKGVRVQVFKERTEALAWLREEFAAS